MADPLSIASGTVGILSLGIQVTRGLLDYYEAYRDQDETVKRISDRLEVLHNSLQTLEKTIQAQQFRSDEVDIVAAITSSISQAEEFVIVLEKKCTKVRASATQSLKGSITLAGSRITYPFRKATLEKLDENIRAAQDNLVLAINILHLRDNQQLHDDAAAIKKLTEMMRASQISTNIRQWLNPPDVTINHNSNCAKRHPGTGLWFIKGDQFNAWLTRPNSFLWVTGFAGSGKSVLCSTAVQYAFRQQRTDPSISVAVACFYFTFTDQSKQDASAMLRALILQLSSQARNGTSDLSSLYSGHEKGVPPDLVLLAYIQQIVKKFDQAYILLDALDEVPRGRARRDVLNMVREMQAWLCPGLHLLVTSRDEVDIRDNLPLDRQTAELQEGVGVDKDIESFIESQLKTDMSLLKWKRHHDKIQTILAEKAHGVFRWVECQLESIRRCPRSVGQLDECLQTLPEDLDQTYERMLCSIQGQSARDAKRMLTALVYAIRPLTVAELIDVIAFDIETSPGLNRDFRYEDVDSLQELCPGLIQIHVPQSVDDSDDEFDEADENRPDILQDSWIRNETAMPVVRIAHFSVQEYLESSRIKRQQARDFALEPSAGHLEMSQICVSYLFEPELSAHDLKKEDLHDLPVVDYAARYWSKHYDQVVRVNNTLHSTLFKLFDFSQPNYLNWIRVYNHDRYKDRQLNLSIEDAAAPHYYASLLGLTSLLESLLDQSIEIDAQEGHRGNALQAASYNGHEQVVQLLLDKGADVNARGGSFDNALQAASSRGHERVVQLLLDRGADVNAQGGLYDTALRAASSSGHERVVRLLLDRGANVNAGGEFYDTALQAASSSGHERVVQLLLDRGADVNARGGSFDNALQAASSRGHERVVQLLLDRGANVHA